MVSKIYFNWLSYLLNQAMNTIKLVVIDDHKLIREAWSLFLDSDLHFSVVGQASSAEEGIELCRRFQPDIVLMDINLTGMDGIEAVPLILKVAPATKILGVSMYAKVSYAQRMMRAGALGYITKNARQDEMKEALFTVNEGKKYISKEIKDNLAREITDEKDEPDNLLTHREMEVVRLLKVGLSSREIALAKSVSAKTVETHRANILKKLKLKNTAELVNYINHYEHSFDR
jgi:DNA-binding NarL/FixJ family response regulator